MQQGKHQVVLNDEQPQHPRQQTGGRPRQRRSKLRPVLAWLFHTTVQVIGLEVAAVWGGWEGLVRGVMLEDGGGW